MVYRMDVLFGESYQQRSGAPVTGAPPDFIVLLAQPACNGPAEGALPTAVAIPPDELEVPTGRVVEQATFGRAGHLDVTERGLTRYGRVEALPYSLDRDGLHVGQQMLD